MTITYNEINHALNEYFFSGRFSMAPVYLDLEGEAAEEVAGALSIDTEDLEEVIGASVSAALNFDRANPYLNHLRQLRDWAKDANNEPPPFTALLCALSIAAERMGADASFSDNNYYERLFELLHIEDDDDKQKLKTNAKYTRIFWRTLNIWLSENDYDRGRPTARPLNSWKYVSYALSQALVRDVERKRLSRLFDHAGLGPGDDVTESDMLLYIHDWMLSGQGPTANLRKLWNVPELRERIVGAALEELATWSGSSGEENGGVHHGRMAWILYFETFPFQSAKPILSVSGAKKSETLQLDEDSPPNAKLAFKSSDGKPCLDFHDDQNLAYLGPLGSIDLEQLLLTSFKLTGMESGAEYKFISKPIIPMVKSENGPHYKEVPRAVLLKEHVILCHDAWQEKVRGFLDICARQGYEVFSSEDLPGVPRGWNLFRNVEILQTLEMQNDQLSVLSPMSGEATIEVTGGLKLGPSLWLSSAPPVLSVSSEKTNYKLTVTREALGEKEEKTLSLSQLDENVEIPLSGIGDADGGNFHVVVESGNKELAEKSISFRSADIPRPLRGDMLGYDLSTGELNIVSASQIDTESDEMGHVRGLNFYGTIDGVESETSCEAQDTAVHIPSGEKEEVADGEWGGGGDEIEAPAESCTIRGYHIWRVEDFNRGDDPFEAKRMDCVTCGLRTMSRTNRRRQRRGGQARTGNQGRPSCRRVEVPSSQDQGNATHGADAVLDALCYHGAGSGGMLKTFCTFLSSEPWFSKSFARDLVSLGHVDIELGQGDSIKSWCVAPPAIVMTGDGAFYLAGFRSTSFLGQLKDALGAAGGTYNLEVLPDRPSHHSWIGLDVDVATATIEEINDPYGRTPMLSVDFPSRLAAFLPSISSVTKVMSPVHVGQVDDLQFFDPRKAKWENVKSMDRIGAFRAGFHGKRYFFHDAVGQCKEGSHEIVKLLAANQEGVRLHGYDENKKMFVSALGCEPPGLFSRALVASSGHLPSIDGGTLKYRNVSPAVARILMSKLYPGGG